MKKKSEYVFDNVTYEVSCTFGGEISVSDIVKLLAERKLADKNKDECPFTKQTGCDKIFRE